jgi:hypothetical protein
VAAIGTGVRFIEAEHAGNTRESTEETELVGAAIEVPQHGTVTETGWLMMATLVVAADREAVGAVAPGHNSKGE